MPNELVDTIAQAPLPTQEHLFSKGLIMPFNCVNSGTRKLMFSTNLEQRLALNEPDVPYISTGYENEFGKYSSSFQIAEEDYTIIARIPKFSERPRDHYYMILLNQAGDQLSILERSDYQHVTESFGYIYDNTGIDILHENDIIKKGTILHRSRAFDEYNNRMDGKNLLALFVSSEETMEDSIIISESASKKLSSPLVHKFNIGFNVNDIPLNLFGNAQNYKVLPDIGEYTKDDILCAIRREQKEEAFYSQDFNRLSQIFLSDEKITVFGRVVDLDIQCNNPEMLDEIYYSQIAHYYNEHMRMCREIVEAVDTYRSGGNISLDYELQKVYSNCLAELNGSKFINERVYSGTILTVTVVEDINANVCDKITNRYGGKGVISRVKPDYMMPKTYDGETIDIQINICGVYGRENAGQLFELTYTYFSKNLVKSLCDEFSSMEENVRNILDFLEIVSPKQKKAVEEFFDKSSDDEVCQFISSIIDDGILYIDVDPGSDTPSLETIAQLHARFPWIQQEYLLMPLVDSTGKVQYVPSRRPLVYGYIYYYRLKQHSEEKFSVTSLSATNIKNENSRNKASKVYKAQFSRTPIRFGYMEMGDMSHMGVEWVIQVLMLYSASPEARMLCEQMMTGNPYDVDIELGNDSTNIGVQMFNAYLKTIGLALKFFKIPKQKLQPLLKKPFKFVPVQSKDAPHCPFIKYDPREYVDHDKVIAQAAERGKYKMPFKWIPFTLNTSLQEAVEKANAAWQADIEAEKKAKEMGEEG